MSLGNLKGGTQWEGHTFESDEAEASRDTRSAVVNHHGVLEFSESFEVLLKLGVVGVPAEPANEKLPPLRKCSNGTGFMNEWDKQG